MITYTIHKPLIPIFKWDQLSPSRKGNQLASKSLQDRSARWTFPSRQGRSKLYGSLVNSHWVYSYLLHPLIEGSLEVKLPTIWTDGKAGVKSQRREEKRREEERRSEKRRSEKKRDAGARKGRKVAIHCFFQWFVAPEGRKVGSLKRWVRCHWPDERWKIARRCGAKNISKSKKF